MFAKRRCTMGVAKTFGQIRGSPRSEGGIGKARQFAVLKSDDDRRLVFGWANIAVRVGGEVIVDWQEDIIDIAELENAAYDYVLHFGTAGEMHYRLRARG
jgi:hypothetical protein